MPLGLRKGAEDGGPAGGQGGRSKQLQSDFKLYSEAIARVTTQYKGMTTKWGISNGDYVRVRVRGLQLSIRVSQG